MKTRTPPDVASCEREARVRYGVIHRSQAHFCRISNRMITRFVSSGRWTQIHTNTFVPRPVLITWETRLMAACLEGGPGTVAAGRAVLRLLGFPRYKDAEVEVACPKHLRLKGVVTHKYRNMESEDIVTIRSIPARRFEPTLLELCGKRDEKKYCGPLLDEALRQKLTHLRWLHRTGYRYGKRGRSGTRLFRTLVAMRDQETALTDSELETLFLRMSKRLSRQPVLHYVAKDEDGNHLSEIDFAYPDLKIAIPLNGYDPHKMRLKWDGDHKTIVLLQNLGWRVLAFTWWQVRFDSDWVLEQIEIAIRDRLLCADVDA